MDVKIGQRKFTLEKMSLYISDLYVQYVETTNEILTFEGDYEEVRLKCEIAREEAESKVDKLRADLAMIKEMKAIKAENLRRAKVAESIRNQIIEEIVILNGYDFDQDSWLKNFGPDDFSALIDELIGKKKAGVVLN